MALNLKFKHLTSVQEMLVALPLVQQLYPEISAQNFPASLKEMIDCNDYKMLAVFDDQKLMAVSGYWLLRMLYCGKYLQISNLIVDKNYRNHGVGTGMLNYFEQYAKEQNCDKFVLDSNITNIKSHELFEREGFYVRGLHFMKNMKS